MNNRQHCWFASRLLVATACCFLVFSGSCKSCHVGSDKLKALARHQIERFLDPNHLKLLYWPNEPLDAAALSKVTGLNITLAETKPELDDQATSLGLQSKRATLVRDFFVTCSADRDRSYTLTINLELHNPFRLVELSYEKPVEPAERMIAYFQVRLPQSSFLVQLNQRISYDECLNVNYVQLSPHISYELECKSVLGGQVPKAEQDYLDKALSKRMSQLDAELDSMLSEKFLLGLQTLLNQRRLDLDLYLKN